MSGPLLLFILSIIFFYVAYQLYGSFLAKKIFNVSAKRRVPSHEFSDGKDFVPSTKQMMFGHHFTSIAGTGPIVGPAIGIIWGWLPAFLWVLCGSIFMGAVHDFGALMISLRHQGRSLSDIAGNYIHPHVRGLFFLIVFLALWIVIAIFGLVIALVFKQFPMSVLAVWLEIPIAIVFGVWLKKVKGSVFLKTLVSVLVLYLTVYLGLLCPIELPVSFIPVTGLWTIILLSYAFFASVLPVSILLQPRDYLNAWQLYVALGLIIMGLIYSGITGQLDFVAPAVNLSPIGAPSMWPFLCITIACGAISGFHSLVCSGTSSKQINSEMDAQFIGFGSMLLEGLLAIVVIIAVGAGIGMAYGYEDVVLTGSAAFQAHYGSWQASAGLGSKLSAVVIGCANMMSSIGVSSTFGIAIVGVLVASFAGTTLDSAARVQRYVISECGKAFSIPILTNKYFATAVAIFSAAILAFSSGVDGKGALQLWPLFGCVNQLLAGLALLVITIYLREKGRLAFFVTGIPCIIMLVVTIWATCLNQKMFILDGMMLLSFFNGIILLLAFFILYYGLRLFVTTYSKHINRKTVEI